MTILIAPDAYKHSLTALQAARIMKKAVAGTMSQAKMVTHPLADGGEGTVATITKTMGGTMVKVPAHDPLMRPVNAVFGYIPEKKTAVVEMAAASGIELLKEHERNPLKTSSYGTGELIKAALELKCRTIIIGIGGSATVDGGMGAVQALGGRFADEGGNELLPEGKSLSRLARIDLSMLDPRLKTVTLKIASDVDNPLTGDQGAARIYGPQKGATPEMVEILEKNLHHLSDIIARDTGMDIKTLPFSGAAGGMGGGFMALLHAQAGPGFEVVRKITGLDIHLKEASLVLTGEGKMDDQDFFGKAPFSLARLARKMKKPVFAFPGSFTTAKPKSWEPYFAGIFPILRTPQSLEEALINAEENLFYTVKEVIRAFASLNKYQAFS